jgi:hypothetical protein
MTTLIHMQAGQVAYRERVADAVRRSALVTSRPPRTHWWQRPRPTLRPA